MVSVGRSDLPLADEAEFIVALLVIPFVIVLKPQQQAILVTAVVVRFIVSPVRVAHAFFPDTGIVRSIAEYYPEKLVLVREVTYSACPKSESMMAAIPVAVPRLQELRR